MEMFHTDTLSSVTKNLLFFLIGLGIATVCLCRTLKILFDKNSKKKVRVRLIRNNIIAVLIGLLLAAYKLFDWGSLF